jgi:hypothetical protein
MPNIYGVFFLNTSGKMTGTDNLIADDGSVSNRSGEALSDAAKVHLQRPLLIPIWS